MANNPFDELKARIPLVEAVKTLCPGISLEREGDRWKASCPLPTHGGQDSTPSFCIYPDNQFHCFGCGRHGSVIDLAMAVCRLDTPEAAKEHLARLFNVPIHVRKRTEATLTLETYAEAKGFDVGYLKSQGLFEDPAKGVGFPYYGPPPEKELLSTRYRKTLNKGGFLWQKGAKAKTLLYGLWKLDKIEAAGKWAVLVEGESDCLTLWRHGYPALGAPGADTLTFANVRYLLDLDRIYVIDEKDKGAAQFIPSLMQHLAAAHWAGELRIVRLQGVKDPSDLYLADRARFKERFDHALNAAPIASLDDRASYQSGAGDVSPSTEYALTDLGNAERLVAQHGDDLRYCHPWGKWLVWDGRHWAPDNVAEVVRRAKQTVRSIYAEASAIHNDDLRRAVVQHAQKSEASGRISAMIQLAQSEPGVPVLPEQLDQDPWLLNVNNGTLDLRTGELRPHERDDLITKVVPIDYDPDAEAPLWLEFLHTIMAGNEELIRFLQRAAGYSLTGDVSEQVLFLCHGGGSNGKSTFLETMLAVLGGYGKPADPDLLLAKRGESHPTGLADLMGCRFAVCIETEQGRQMAEALTKQLTGGDTIKARFMRQDFFEFRPTHKLWLATNHRPVIRGTVKAIWRRIRLIPFEVTIDKPDKRLPKKLLQELPGILAWAVQGCLAWQREGLNEPMEVIAATESYREEMDTLGTFLADCCVQLPNARVKNADLYQAYSQWCETVGEPRMSQRGLSLRLQERGFQQYRKKEERGWLGLGLKANSGNGVTDNLSPKTHPSPYPSPTQTQSQSGFADRVTDGDRGFGIDDESIGLAYAHPETSVTIRHPSPSKCGGDEDSVPW